VVTSLHETIDSSRNPKYLSELNMAGLEDKSLLKNSNIGCAFSLPSEPNAQR
jgi:hypothetical protein